MKWRILGPIEASGHRVVPRPQRRAVLAYLLLHANEVVSTEQLIGAVWDGSPPPSARTQIQANVSHLRRSLGDAIRAQPGGYRIVVADGDLDAAAFTALVAKARSAADPAEAADLLREALAIWRGPALGGATGAFVAAAAAELEARRRWAYNRLAELESGPRRAVPALLPAGIAGFTGRAEQLRWLDERLDPSTVVIASIEGTAGVGKTALAVHWAHRVASRFPDGRLYVNLQGFGPRDAVDPVTAVRGFLTALGIPAARMPADPAALTDLYRSELAGRRVLIVLDNARDADQVRPLLPGTPGCLVVVTSRTRLLGLAAVDGARAMTLDLLSAAQARAMLAARLGAERVRAEPSAVDDVIAACARLPLALAVVAARAAAQPGFPLAVLAGELRGRLDPFAVEDPAADLRAVFSWSYRTLDTPAAHLFRLLGLHPGPDVTVDAAASLAGLTAAAVRPLLDTLARAHLLHEHRPGRFTLHDLLHEYATELATATEPPSRQEAAVDRLLDHYVHTAYAAALLLEPLRPRLVMPEPQTGAVVGEPADIAAALSWFDSEHPALLQGIELAARRGRDGHTWRLAWSITEYLDRRGHWPEQAAIQHHALAAVRRSAGPAERVTVHFGLARAYLRLGRYADAEHQYRQALDICVQLADPAGQARIHLDLATVFGRQDQHRAALAEARRSLDLYESAGHPVGVARGLNLVGWYHAQLGEYAQTLEHCERALILQQDVGHRHGEAATWDSLGYAHHHLGHHDEAVDCYERALDLLRDLGERYYQADTLTHLGQTHHAAGNDSAARTAWLEAVAILGELGHPDAEGVRALLRDAAQPATSAPPLPEPLVIVRTLGVFEVHAGGGPVKWPSYKARDAFKILIARRGRPMSRGALAEALWPQAKPDRIANRLAVALSTIRSVLDPHRKHPPIVVSEGDRVRLETQLLRIDVEDFLGAAQAGLALYRSGDPAAVERLAQAASAYTGEFLEADDWASDVRDDAAAIAVQVAYAQADLAEADGDVDAAVRHLLLVLARDSYDERAHLAVVRLLRAAGRHGEARRRYREYADRMSELDVVAAPWS